MEIRQDEFKIMHEFISSNKLQVIHKSQYNTLLLRHKQKFKFVYYFELVCHKGIIWNLSVVSVLFQITIQHTAFTS